MLTMNGTREGSWLKVWKNECSVRNVQVRVRVGIGVKAKTKKRVEGLHLETYC